MYDISPCYGRVNHITIVFAVFKATYYFTLPKNKCNSNVINITINYLLMNY